MNDENEKHLQRLQELEQEAWRKHSVAVKQAEATRQEWVAAYTAMTAAKDALEKQRIRAEVLAEMRASGHRDQLPEA